MYAYIGSGVMLLLTSRSWVYPFVPTENRSACTEGASVRPYGDTVGPHEGCTYSSPEYDPLSTPRRT